LLSNALKFTQKGSITTKIKYDNETHYMLTEITDTGSGISINDLNKLFKLFGKMQSNIFENKTGIGLGLNLCKSIVSEFDG
jgi:K+-sensing histidine kinase KdpD